VNRVPVRGTGPGVTTPVENVGARVNSEPVSGYVSDSAPAPNDGACVNSVPDRAYVPDTVPAGGGGIVTVTAGGTTIETLDSSREREHEHMRTALYAQSGASAGTYTVSYYRRPFNVTADTDIIPLPHEFHDLMETGIMGELQKFRGEWANYAISKREFQERMREFRAWNNREPGMKRGTHARKQWGYPRRYT